MKIVDFHIHPFLDETQNLAFFPGSDRSEDVCSRLKGSGITHVCGSVISRDPACTVWELNETALRLKEAWGEFYTPDFHIHPAQIERSVQEIERMHGLGVKLIGEVVPYIHGWANFNWSSYVDELNVILDAAEKRGMVFSYHNDWAWNLEPVIAAHPGMAFVAAHPGERGGVDSHIIRMRKFENAYLDISGTGILRMGCIEHLVNTIGADRILFGTDYPICNHDLYIHAVRTARISDADKEKILYGNAERLLGP